MSDVSGRTNPLVTVICTDRIGSTPAPIILAPEAVAACGDSVDTCGAGPFDLAQFRELEAAFAHAKKGKDFLVQRRFAEAEESCRAAIELGCCTPGAWSNLGAAHQALRQHRAAVESFRAAVALMPGSAVLLSNLGNALIDAGAHQEAREVCAQAAALDPGLAEVQVNWGRALHHCGERHDAILRFRAALALRPGSANAHYHLGVSLLATGQFAEGWAEYEHRLQLPDSPFRPLIEAKGGPPLWDGTAMPGRTLLVIAEQGLGDIIQFGRFVPFVEEKFGRVVVRVPRRLQRLLRGIAELSPDDGPLPHFDVWCPLMSLPHRLRTTLEAIPAPAAYLLPDPARVERWRRVLPAARLRVGIAWQGNPNAPDDAGRSVPLALFEPLAAVAGVELISLQVGAGSDQLPTSVLASTVLSLGPDFDAGPDAFVDTAAVMASLDLVITTDTAIAHMAGALGRPAWMVLRAHLEWRWPSVGNDTPWYPSVRLFRQERDGEWCPVFQQLGRVLEGLAGLKPVADGIVQAPMSPGDLLDRITILEVKAERISDPTKQANVLRELYLLREAHTAAGLDWGRVRDEENSLRVIHARLWDAENIFRGCAGRNEFGSNFVFAAHTVIQENATRAKLKQAINRVLRSALREEKHYAD